MMKRLLLPAFSFQATTTIFSLISSRSARAHLCQRNFPKKTLLSFSQCESATETIRVFSSTDSNDSFSPGREEDISLQFATEYHAPVMCNECIDALLDCARNRDQKRDLKPLLFVDGTLGGGGHSAALLQRLKPGDVVFGCDVDPNALFTASERLKGYMGDEPSQSKPLFIPIQSNFCDLVTSLPTEIIQDGVDGILLDLGVSSHQIDEPERGFAFMKEGPLDMRMNSNTGLTAADICNEFDEIELQRIFGKYGDEPRSKVIAKAICNARPLRKTSDLASAIASVTPEFAKNKRLGRAKTCARVFQSLRIVVNNEDKVLEKALSQTVPSLIRPGGRLVVLSYHSMEDRATKRIMRDGTLGKFVDRRDIYGNTTASKPFKPVGKRRKASQAEIDMNPRARSAVLRVAERL
jgi:16S rRNA (cytosine1402-N4)-methyltransferase